MLPAAARGITIVSMLVYKFVYLLYILSLNLIMNIHQA